MTVERVTLLRPGSVTHHADSNQRCVELNFLNDTPGALKVFTPSLVSGILPRGYYMMLLVFNTGVPSEAAWVSIE